jgi:undecaprenyl-diphosphatase
MNFIHQIDYELFTIINNVAGRWPWLDTPAHLFLNDYFVPTVLAITLLALWFDRSLFEQKANNREAVVVGSLSAALANALLKIMNLLYHRPRPFDTYAVNLLFYQPTDSSLPSNAAALSFSVATGVWIFRRRWGWPLLGLATIFGLSRIFGGVHYPLDIITGAILGYISTYFIHWKRGLVNRLLHLIITLTHKLGLEACPEPFLRQDKPR